MALGREDIPVTRTNGGADVFGLAGFFRDDNLIGHDELGWRISMRTYSEQKYIASWLLMASHWPALAKRERAVVVIMAVRTLWTRRHQ
jgi:hypothetical protein